MYVAIDDSDTRGRMCTTYLIYRIIKDLHNEVDIIGYPHLVRLNPNIPWKTRGNGAVCVRIGEGCGKKTLIGKINGKEIYGYPRMCGEVNSEVKRRIYEIVESFREEDSDTALLFCERKPKEEFYYKAVREVIKDIPTINCEKFWWGNGRGLIGAYASLAWRARKKTYECLAYLPEDLWNIERREEILDVKIIKNLEKKYPSLFDCYDYKNEYVVMMPRSKTPVLFGVRSLIPEECIKASEEVAKSSRVEIDGFLVFKTNQATDDHIVNKRIADIKKYDSVKVRGKVVSKPKVIEGGHVIFRIRDSSGEIDCASYEPTKEFRKVVMSLIPGDVVDVYGGISEYPNTINLEKMRVVKIVERIYRNPLCKKCNVRMESVGRNKGFRCPKCGAKRKTMDIERIDRKIKVGEYDVPPVARRHLTRPFFLTF